MNAYEMTYIVRPDLDDDGTRAVIDGVTGRLESGGGEIIAALPWNPPRRRMAYPIKDFGDGFYVTTVFRIESQALGPIENALKLNDRILRFLLVRATDLNIKQAQQRLQQQQAAAAAPRPQPATAPAPAPVGAGSAVPSGSAVPAGSAAPAARAEATSPAEPETVAEPVATEVAPQSEAAEPETVEPEQETVEAEPAPEPVTAAASESSATQPEE